MKCVVCQNYFVKQHSFSTLWKRYFLCSTCENTYTIEPTLLALPTSKKPFIVQTMIPIPNRDEHVEQALLLVYPNMFPYPYPAEFDIILFADPWVVATRRVWEPLVSHLGSILMYSVFGFSWEE